MITIMQKSHFVIILSDASYWNISIFYFWLEFWFLYFYMRNFCNLIGLEQWYFSLIWNTYMWKLQTFCGKKYKQIIAWFVRDIWHKYHSWYFKIVSNFTRLMACEISYNNFEISLLLFMPNITTNHAITYTNSFNNHIKKVLVSEREKPQEPR